MLRISLRELVQGKPVEVGVRIKALSQGLLALALILGLGSYALAKEKAKAKKTDKVEVTPEAKPQGGKTMDKVQKTDAQWKEELPYETFCIMRQQGTESPFHNKYWDMHEDGKYYCAACHNLLFLSDTKFDSGTGWPSYFQPADPKALTEVQDTNHGYIRTEVNCARCGGHLGHVFPDGPAPSGLRYCINSAALVFEPNKPATPDTKGKK
jgi:peptide-methionine (R)-S-oxide reductase